MPSDLKRVTRALLSVSDKTGLVDFARALSARFPDHDVLPLAVSARGAL